MAKKIKESDIFQGDIFANAKKSAESYLGSLNALQGELKEMLAINKSLLAQSTKQLKTTSDLQKRTQAIQNVTKADKGLVEVEKEKIRVEQETEKLAQQRQKTEQQRQKTRVQNRKEEERLAKIKAKNLKLAKQEGQAYSKMSKRLNELRNKYKNLAVQNKENTKEGQRLLKTIQKLDGRLKRVDKTVGQSQRNVGNYTSAWGKLGMRLKSVASSFGLIGGVMGAVQLVKSAFNVVTDFDSAIANLGAISNATEDDLSAMTENAKALGETTKFTATEVAGLSVELAKLGFTTPEILDSTESILALASATGTDLSQASFIAGSTLRAFNLEASEMDRVASVLGVSTTKSALNMEFLGTAMSKVAPVSSAMGFSIEDTTALLGTLANAGFDASTSATATRNILLNLADSSGDLAQALGRPVKSLDDLAPALAELEAKGIDIAEALELTDKRSVAAFKTFLNGTDTLIELRDSITDVNQELADMSEKQLDTINGQLALLNSKWQGMIIGASESGGAVDKIKKAIGFLTENLETILKTLVKVIKAFVIYKTTMFAFNTAMKIGTAIQKAYRIAVVMSNRGIKSATRSMKLFNVTMKSNPIGLIISALTTAVALFWDFSESVNQATANVDSLEDSYKRLRDQQEKTFKGIDDDSKQRIAEIDLEIAKLEQANGSEEDIAKLKKERLDEEIKSIQKKSQILKDSIKKDVETITQAGANIQDFELGVTGLGGFNLTPEQLAKRNKVITEGRAAAVELAIQNKKLQEDELKALQTQLKLSKTENETKKIGLDTDNKINETTKKTTKSKVGLNNELSKLKKSRSEIERQRTNELLLNGTTAYFKELTKVGNELDSQIDKYQEILKGQKAIEVENKKVKDIGVKTIGEENDALDDRISAFGFVIDAMETEADKEAEVLAQRTEAYKQFTTEIINLIDKRTDKQLDAIDKEMSESQKREDELRTLAQKGTITAQNSLAAEQKRQAELERQREELEKKKIRRQAVLSGLDLLSSKIDNDEPDAVASTIRDIASLVAIISNLPAFAEGSEYIERGKAPKGKDTIIARVDEGERIMTREQNRQLSGISNDELTKIAQDYKTGSFNDIQYMKPKVKELHTPFQSTSMILDKFDSLQKTIENKPMLTEVRWDEVSNMIVEKVEIKNRIENKHKSTKGIF